MKQQLTYNHQYQLSYAEYGDQNAYPILIQHGLIASIADYDLFERLLQNNARLICIARPGYGDSSPYLMKSYAEWAEIVSYLIEKLSLSHFDILGMSSGAPYSYALGYRFPDQARKIYIFSGIPALYDELVRANWPYPVSQNTSLPEMQKLAHELFFANLTEEDLQKNDIRDSLSNNAFGVAQDLRLRFVDWGFNLSAVAQMVFMHHSKTDDSVPYKTAVRTAELLPDCQLELTETGSHFSSQALDDFIAHTMLKNINTSNTSN